MDDTLRNMIIASIVLVLLALYGGQTLGSWFFVSGEVEDTDSSNSLDFEATFNLEGYEYEVSIRDGDSKEKEDGKIDYDDNDCSSPDYGGASDCDELYDLMQGKIQNLLYVIILAGGAALFFLNDGDQEKGALACLAMGSAGLLAVALFAMSFPEALDDDTEAFEMIDDDPSIIGDNNNFGEEFFGAPDSEVNWRPGFAFVLVGMFV